MKDLASSVERILGMGPIPPETPVEEILCWLKAKREDLEQEQACEDRAQGIVPACDAKLFMEVLRPYDDGMPLGEAFEILRRKKRRGHRQQKALDLWDQHYKGRDWFLELEPKAGKKKPAKKAGKG